MSLDCKRVAEAASQ